MRQLQLHRVTAWCSPVRLAAGSSPSRRRATGRARCGGSSSSTTASTTRWASVGPTVVEPEEKVGLLSQGGWTAPQAQCASQRRSAAQIYLINTQEEFPLFVNAGINRERAGGAVLALSISPRPGHSEHARCWRATQGGSPPRPSQRSWMTWQHQVRWRLHAPPCPMGVGRLLTLRVWLRLATGSVEWLDKSKRQALVLWRKIPEWAATIYSFVKTYGLGDSVMVVDELSTGDDVRGTGEAPAAGGPTGSAAYLTHNGTWCCDLHDLMQSWRDCRARCWSGRSRCLSSKAKQSESSLAV